MLRDFRRNEKPPRSKYVTLLQSLTRSSAHYHASEMSISVVKASLPIKPPLAQRIDRRTNARILSRSCWHEHGLGFDWRTFAGFDCLVTGGTVHKVAHRGGRWKCAPKVKHNHDTSGEGEGTGGRAKWEPAAPTAHHVFKSFYDPMKKAKTNNRTFSIIYNSDVRSASFDELPGFCAWCASFVCACSLLYALL